MKLIINADDLGVDPSRNKGIFACVDAGALASVSLIVAQGGWEDALSGLKERPSVGAGLHFNLTAGRPLVPAVPTIVTRQSVFYDKFELLRRALTGELDPEEVDREFRAQWGQFLMTGLSPTHIDGHNHVHLLPGVREVVKEIVPAGTWVRLPSKSGVKPVDPLGDDPKAVYNEPCHLTQALNHLSDEARKLWGDRFRYVDDFGGHFATETPTFRTFQQEIQGLKGDVCELMVHPGDEWDDSSVRFSRLRARQMERDILVSAEFRSFLERSGITVISYRDEQRRKK